jgi:hypothetical protein
VADKRDWKKEVIELRRSAQALVEKNPDAALMRCRKANEAILFSIFEEKNGELPYNHIPFEKIIGKGMLGSNIPDTIIIELQTVQTWGNLGCHYQLDDDQYKLDARSAFCALDNLIKWKFSLSEEGLSELLKESKHTKSESKHTKPESKRTKPSDYDYKFLEQFTKLTMMARKKGEVPKGGFKDITKYFDTVVKKYALSHDLKKISSDVHRIIRAIELCTDNEGWALMSDIGNRIRDLDPSFKINSTGHDKLSSLIRSYPKYFEIRPKKAEKGKPYSVKIKNISGN